MNHDWDTKTKLFAAVRKYPLLYDPSDGRFGNGRLQAAAWKEIAQHIREPNAELMWKRLFIRRKGQITVQNRYLTELSWLQPFIETVGSAAHREISLAVIAAVRKLPELYDSSHPLYGDEAHADRLWKDLKHSLNTSAKCRWRSMRDVYESTLRTRDNRNFWYGKEMEWLRPYLHTTSSCVDEGTGDDSARPTASHQAKATQQAAAVCSSLQNTEPNECGMIVGLEEFGLESLIPELLSLAQVDSERRASPKVKR